MTSVNSVQTSSNKTLGFDVFVVHKNGVPQVPTQLDSLRLKMIANRGTKVWPGDLPPIHLTDVYQCRYEGNSVNSTQILSSLAQIESAGFDWVHVEKLLEINGQIAYAKAQGE